MLECSSTKNQDISSSDSDKDEEVLEENRESYKLDCSYNIKISLLTTLRMKKSLKKSWKIPYMNVLRLNTKTSLPVILIKMKKSLRRTGKVTNSNVL